ncbi:TPA: arginine--tRNA ligase [Candidatus Gastranaerophilales bacterium HUM_6]|nr:arginine--tRNA ligase [Fusobacterium sp. CAG:815]DAA89745.1 MAG TPA: arginine--tRNA ligase [Candidatus Gastranaerophilales bacterium HUM_6]DAA91588.1 MAG TPA: arginine--tRNA ligase [Candidatus Gastranaerophilales bacterium HUM_7]DAB04174.1 MAG TPA: arginine--tRNA ligase [Candidatus Gastranaerophilales bacterium HUM_12]DAB05594.1 MAG TPA: arginine--tRNA ligase [Candidatus Gastranaerophilales bacterium HUM_14]
MLKDYFLNKVENAINEAVNAQKLGQMSEYAKGSLVVEKPKNPDFGDLAINVSSLARSARIAPPMIANSIVEFIDKKDCEYSVIGGFINFRAGNSLLINLVDEIFEKNKDFGRPENINKEKIILEYISANPTGPFHIGHGRWAAMGSALANLLKFYGHDVYQEFYINDAGSQIQKLGRSLVIRVKQELGQDIDFPTDEVERKNYYPGDYLIPVAKNFVEDYKSELESLNNDADKIDLKVYCDFAKDYEEKVQRGLLDNFRVHFDNFYSELTLHKSGKVDECVQKLRDSGKIYEKEGAVWFKSSDYGDDQDRVIKKADGSNTYLTADIAYHVDKLERGFDRMINIWGADHHGYVARVKASIEALGYDSNKLEVLLGQLVNLVINGNEVRMGKRKNMVTLEDLIDEVGVDATRFWMAMRNIDTTLDFDIELAKTNSDENPVFYVQYAHARACSIIRNATNDRVDTESGKTISPVLTKEEFENLISNFDKNIMNSTIKDARKLILKLEEFKSLIVMSAQTRQVYTICRYVQELAAEFHSFYNSTRVITDDIELTKARLALVWAFKTVLSNALDILAVSAPERM